MFFPESKRPRFTAIQRSDKIIALCILIFHVLKSIMDDDSFRSE
jgi:hypothetical protein